MKKQKIAIVYDWIDKWGGVERVLLMLHEMFPQAEFYTSYYDPEKALWAKNLKIKTSFIQRFPSFMRGNRIVSLPFYPYAFESFNFSNYDIVISVTSSFSKSIITKPDTQHLCYLLTPTRFLWFQHDEYFKNKAVRLLLSPYLAKLREWDFVAAQRPDHIISISQTVADRCKKYYKRKSEVIYPPFDIKYWKKIKKNVILGTPPRRGTPEILDKPGLLDSGRPRDELGVARMTTEKNKYFLVVSRLEPYKKINLVIETFSKLTNLPTSHGRGQVGNSYSKYSLIVVGKGSQLNRLKQMSGEKIVFFDELTDIELGYLYSRAEALIMPQEEDFGYVSLEAQFFGCPVIAYKKGGASETVMERKTGIFFEEQSAESLKSALRKFNMVKYELKHKIKEFGLKNIEKYSKKVFINKFKNLLKTLSS